MGRLTAPFKVLGCLGLLAALVVGWLYRDRVLREGRRILDGSRHLPRSGRPRARLAARARGLWRRPGPRSTR